MIITEEELLALLDEEVSLEPGFHPVSIYALDAVSYQAAKAAGVPEYASLHRIQPDPSWQWEGGLTTSAIVLFEPSAHAGGGFLPQLLAQGEGVYRPEQPWLMGLQTRAQRWRDWLAGLRVLLLEDHPFQGPCIAQEIQGLGMPCQWVQDGDACLQVLQEEEVGLLICDLSLAEQDAISLLSLLQRHPQLAGGPLYDRLRAFLTDAPAPSRDAVLQGAPGALDAWWNALPYPRAKRWWLQWPDALPAGADVAATAEACGG